MCTRPLVTVLFSFFLKAFFFPGFTGAFSIESPNLREPEIVGATRRVAPTSGAADGHLFPSACFLFPNSYSVSPTSWQQISSSAHQCPYAALCACGRWYGFVAPGPASYAGGAIPGRNRS